MFLDKPEKSILFKRHVIDIGTNPYAQITMT